MNHHTRRLVDEQDMVVFIHDVQWQLLWDDFVSNRVSIRVKDDLVCRFYLVIGLDGLVVHQDHAIVNGPLDLVPGGIDHPVQQEFIYSQGFLAFVHFNRQSFVQFF